MSKQKPWRITVTATIWSIGPDHVEAALVKAIKKCPYFVEGSEIEVIGKYEVDNGSRMVRGETPRRV